MKKKEMRKKYPKPLEELTLLDRFLFDVAMSDSEICKNILSIILKNKKVTNIRIGIMEKTQEPFYNSRAVRLDTLAFDEDDTVYDAEAQKSNKGRRVICRRSRLYQAHVDVSLMEPGDVDFAKMNDTYIIFICPFDIFGYGKYMYTFQMECEEVPGLRLEDGATRIFLNTHGQNHEEVSEELIQFLHYAETMSVGDEKVTSPRVLQLAKQVDEIKSNQEVGVKYMRMWEEFVYERMEGREEGREEGRDLKCIRQVRANLLKGRDTELIADFLEEELEKINFIANIIKQQPDLEDEEILYLLMEKAKETEI